MKLQTTNILRDVGMLCFEQQCLGRTLKNVGNLDVPLKA